VLIAARESSPPFREISIYALCPNAFADNEPLGRWRYSRHHGQVVPSMRRPDRVKSTDLNFEVTILKLF
jgi:hypothetical protein